MFSENIHDVHKVTATHYTPENSHAVSFTVHGAGDIRKDITLYFGDTFGPNPDGAENANALFVALGGDHSMTTETDRLTDLLAASEATRADLVNTIAELRAEVERLREALDPSGSTKNCYIGEFSFTRELIDEDGDGVDEELVVPWTTIKEIMAAISARAALEAKP